MISGALMIPAGLVLGFYGATRFNLGLMIMGYLIAGAGAVVFFASFLSLP